MLRTGMQGTCRISMLPMCTMPYCRSALPTLSKHSVNLLTSIGMKFRHSRQPISQRRSLVDLLSYFFPVYDVVFLPLQAVDCRCSLSLRSWTISPCSYGHLTLLMCSLLVPMTMVLWRRSLTKCTQVFRDLVSY